jgi:hypothetical protein
LYNRHALTTTFFSLLLEEEDDGVTDGATAFGKVSKQVNLVFFGGGVTKVDDWVEDEEEDKEVFESGVSISIDNMRMRWEYQIREITFIWTISISFSFIGFTLRCEETYNWYLSVRWIREEQRE